MASQSLKQKYGTSEEVVMGSQSAIAATNPVYQLTKKWNTVSSGTSPSTGVALPTGKQGMTCVIFNKSGATLNVAPKVASGDYINSNTPGTPVSIVAGKAAIFTCYDDSGSVGRWIMTSW